MSYITILLLTTYWAPIGGGEDGLSPSGKMILQ